MSRLAIPAPTGLGNELALVQPRLAELIRRYTLVSFALLFLVIGSAATEVGSHYWSAHAVSASKPVAALHPKQISGLNSAVDTSQLQAKLQTITSQPATLNLGTQTVAISPRTIQSWIQVTHDKQQSVDYLHVNQTIIAKSLTDLANKYVKTPINQVTTTYADGTSRVIIAGRNGTKLTDPTSLATQAQQAAKTVMDGKGLNFSTGLETQPFQAVTPAAFAKLIEVNVVTKQMYLYDNGNLTRTYPISAGKPSTPTPIGEYKIYSKFATQDMKGLNPDGSKYLQPHVHWINYFLPGGYAVHGNYWRPMSWFGVINSSHGCVSLPDFQAKWVYDWAPIGTTVITHT